MKPHCPNCLKEMTKASASRNLFNCEPCREIIQFFGGIHEIYFPYVLAHPIMLGALLAGGMTADTWFMVTDAGLVATPSPGPAAKVAIT